MGIGGGTLDSHEIPLLKHLTGRGSPELDLTQKFSEFEARGKFHGALKMKGISMVRGLAKEPWFTVGSLFF